jgi:hypothetical protein
MQRMVHKFSIVYLSEGEKTEVFRSLVEVPEDARKRLTRLARTSKVETLLIANERGRQMLETGGLQNSKPNQTGMRLSTPMKIALATGLASGVALLMLLVWNFK